MNYRLYDEGQKLVQVVCRERVQLFTSLGCLQGGVVQNLERNGMEQLFFVAEDLFRPTCSTAQAVT